MGSWGPSHRSLVCQGDHREEATARLQVSHLPPRVQVGGVCLFEVLLHLQVGLIIEVRLLIGSVLVGLVVEVLLNVGFIPGLIPVEVGRRIVVVIVLVLSLIDLVHHVAMLS